MLLDKTPGVRTVVTKSGNIESVFRTFPMEVVAGDEDTLVETTHLGHKFKFDFAKVHMGEKIKIHLS